MLFLWCERCGVCVATRHMDGWWCTHCGSKLKHKTLTEAAEEIIHYRRTHDKSKNSIMEKR